MVKKGNTGHHYFDKLNYVPFCLDVESCGRNKFWKEQRKKYGFDSRQIWNLDTTMVELLYERLKMYKKTVGGYFGKKHDETTSKLLKLCVEYLKCEDFSKQKDAWDELWQLWRTGR